MVVNSKLFSVSLVVGIFGSLVSIGEANDSIRILYNERAPYLISVSPGAVTGLTATPASFAFQQSGIPHFWEKIPSIRQMAILQGNTGKDCLVGWFKNAERANFAKYTKPIYQDKPAIGLALFSNVNIESGQTLKKVFQNKRLRILTKNGYSYGAYIDGLIQTIKPTQVKVTVENINMVHMLKVERADYIFMAEEEAEGLIKKAQFTRDEFKFIRFMDMPAGSKRYILCSMQVADQVIEKLNVWIEKNVGIQ